MCWSAGFRKLTMNPYSSRQLRALDCHRRIILNAAKRRILEMRAPDNIVERMDDKKRTEKNSDSIGMAHSYYYQFYKKTLILTRDDVNI